MYADFKITQNDTTEPIEGVCLDESGSPVDLTGATVRFQMKQHGADAAKVDAVATVSSALEGEFLYSWQAGDTDTPGVYWATFQVTHSDGGVESFPDIPLRVYIPDEIA